MTRGTDVTDMKRMYTKAVASDFPFNLNLELTRECDLRYGENPSQLASMYKLAGNNLATLTNIRLAKTGKDGLSATNFMDVTRALNILKFFDPPAVAVMKHLVPSGFARQHNGNSLESIYEQARDTDLRSSFGSVVVSNQPIDKSTAEAIVSTYVEGVTAPEFEEGVMKILEKRKNLRAILYSNLDIIPKFEGDDTEGLYDTRVLPTGRVLVQKPYLSSIRSVEDLVLDPLVVDKDGGEHVVERDPTSQEVDDLLTSWYVNLGVRSNGIVFVKDGVTVAIGTGQQERIGAIEQAVIKAYQKAMDREVIEHDAIDGAIGRGLLSQNPLEGAVMSSDAFFPFRDSIDLMARQRVTAVIQPGGSLNDPEVIDAINEHKMAMAFTLERCFGHF